MNEHQNLTWDEIRANFAEASLLSKENEKELKELKQLFKESKERMEELNRKWNENFDKENRKWNENFDKENKKWNENFDKENKKWNENFDKENKNAEKRLAKLEKLIGGIGNNNGDMAEEFFFNAFRKDKIFMNEKFDKIQKGYFYSNDPYRGEFDIVLFNGTCVAIIEVKYRAQPENIDIETLLLRVERLKQYSPEYKNHNIYLAVAAMSFKKGLATKLHHAGIATIHPVGKKMVIYDKNVKIF